MKNRIVIGVVAILVIIVVGIYFLNKKNDLVGSIPDGVICTMDAKLCPDGSYVGRVGPKCEFTTCPVSEVKKESIASINQRILYNGVYITPLQVLEDNRCPENVVCIQAGQVRLKVKVELGSVVKTIDLTEGIEVVVDDKKISLQNVLPMTNSEKPISESDYRFTFNVASSK